MPAFRKIGSRLGDDGARARPAPGNLPPPGAVWNWGYGRPGDLWPPGARMDYSREAGDLSGNSVVAVCVGWLQDNFPTARPQVLRKSADGSEDPDPEHDLLDLLARPNDAYSAAVLWGATVLDFKIDGNAYWIKWRDAGGEGRPVRLWYEPSVVGWQRQVVPWRAPGSPNLVDKYFINRPDGRYELDPADVVHFRDGLDPVNPMLGCSRLKKVLRNIVGLNRAESYTAAILGMGGTGGILMPKNDSLPIDESEGLKFKARLERDTTGENAGRYGLVSWPMDFARPNLGPQEMALDTILDRPEATVCGAIGVSPMVVGLAVGNNTRTFSNYKEAENQTWVNGLVPMQDRMADDLGMQLLVDFEDTAGLRVAWDRADVKALQEDADARAARAVSLYQARVGRLNECRALAGLPAIEGQDETWYDPAGPAAADQMGPDVFSRNGVAA